MCNRLSSKRLALVAALLVLGLVQTSAAGATVTNPLAFDAPQTYSPGSSLHPFAVAAADVNGDNKPDIVTANAANSGSVSVIPNGGTGPFANTYPTGINTDAVAVEDLNDDGYRDIVATNGGSGTVSVLLNDPSNPGTFEPAVNYAVGTAPAGLAVTDLNGDHRPDIVVANNQSNNVSVLINNGDGTFGNATNYPVGPTPNGVVVADFNQDGNPDIAVNSFGTTSVPGTTISVLYADGSGGFNSYQSFPAGNRPYRLADANLNGDEYPDIALIDYPGALGEGTNTVQLLLNNGMSGASAGFDSPSQVGIVPIQSPNGGLSITTADLSGGGNQDILLNDGNTAYIYPGDGTGAFGPGVGVFTGPANWVTTADMNGDSALDLVAADQSSPDGTASVNLHIIPPSNTSAPTLPTTALANEPLVGSVGDWDSIVTPSYKWQVQRCDADGNGCHDASGESGQGLPLEFAPTSGDAGYRLRVGVTATNPAGSAGPVYSNLTDVVPPPPVATVPPTISGTPQVGQVVKASGDKWNMPVSVSVQWWSCPNGDTDPSDYQNQCFPFASGRSLQIPNFAGGGEIEAVLTATSAANGAGIATTQLDSLLDMYPTVLSPATVTKSYSASIIAYGGNGPYTFTSSTLPPGLSISSDGTISGTPTAAGTFKSRITVTDSSSPALTLTKTYLMRVVMLVQPPTLPKGHVGQSYSQALTAAGANGAVTWTTNQANLPPGLSLSSDGTLSGTPTTTGTYSFNVKATDSASPANTATRAYTVKVS